MSRFFLKVLNFTLNMIILISIVLSAGFAGFALWDNSQVYSAVEDVQKDMIKLKPEANPEDNGESFEKLREINSDVQAWISMDETQIDYPVLQGESNMTYLNTDVYGEFALQGSIFMDSRNNPDFSQKYIILYGHHMDGGKMFGDLDKFKDSKFFYENGSGVLILPDRTYDLQVFGTLVLKASDERIFNPALWTENSKELPEKLKGEFKLLKEDLLPAIGDNDNSRILALTTCTNEFTDARTIVLTVMTLRHTDGVEE